MSHGERLLIIEEHSIQIEMQKIEMQLDYEPEKVLATGGQYVNNPNKIILRQKFEAYDKRLREVRSDIKALGGQPQLTMAN